MPRTRVVNIHDEPCDVMIDRSTDWGNPFVIGIDGTREQVIAMHKINLMRRPDLRRRAQVELKGKRLGCHCHPLPCHGDNYIELLEPCPPSPT